MIGNRIALRPYQYDTAVAIMESVEKKKGLTFSVEIARQGGKNELSAFLEACLLFSYSGKNPQNLVKCAPTFKPQTVISMTRLTDRLNGFDLHGQWKPERGYIIRVGNASAIFLSADTSSNVVGHTCQLLLEIDESQDIDKDKYSKEFKPMGATSNVTTVHYGTTWDNTTLLEEIKQTNLELERKDGIRRHFRFDWEEVAKYNPDYQVYVQGERDRLGDSHPLFQTQYKLIPVRGSDFFLSSFHRLMLEGEHSRLSRPTAGKTYVAGIDLAGEAEEEEGAVFRAEKPRQDSTVLTIGEIGPGSIISPSEPGIKIVEHYRWRGKKHTDLYAQLVDILKNVWRIKRIVVDATGVGQPVASFLKHAIGSAVIPFTFTQSAKSELGFNLLSAINSSRLKMYAGDNSAEYREFWTEMEQARSHYRPSQTMNFFVEPARGHDDFLMSLALMVEAANRDSPRTAKGR